MSVITANSAHHLATITRSQNLKGFSILMRGFSLVHFVQGDTTTKILNMLPLYQLIEVVEKNVSDQDKWTVLFCFLTLAILVTFWRVCVRMRQDKQKAKKKNLQSILATIELGFGAENQKEYRRF